jgi:hypothetical protein
VAKLTLEIIKNVQSTLRSLKKNGDCKSYSEAAAYSFGMLWPRFEGFFKAKIELLIGVSRGNS